MSMLRCDRTIGEPCAGPQRGSKSLQYRASGKVTNRCGERRDQDIQALARSKGRPRHSVREAVTKEFSSVCRVRIVLQGRCADVFFVARKELKGAPRPVGKGTGWFGGCRS
jgi:hypothetical protein